MSEYLADMQHFAYIATVAVPVAVAGAMKAHRALKLRAQRVIELHSKVDAILKEFIPNGGGSLKDQVTSMRDDVKKLKANVAVLRDGLRFSLGLQPTAVFESNESGRCTNASPALCEMFGMTHEEMLGLGWLAAVDSAEERDRAWLNWRSAVDSGMPYKDRYLVHNGKTGERFHVTARAVASKTDDGVIRYFFGCVEKEKKATT